MSAFSFHLVVGGARHSAFFPVFAELLGKRRDPEAWELTATVLNSVMLLLAVLGGLSDPKDLHDYTVTHFGPFNPVDKLTEATATDPDGMTTRVSKGAPQVTLDLADDTAKTKPANDPPDTDM